jgi:hypothetical protein
MWELPPHKNNVGTRKSSPGNVFPKLNRFIGETHLVYS